MYKINIIQALVFLSIVFGCKESFSMQARTAQGNEEKKEVLLIGTFHYNNPGKDAAKTKSFDVLSEESQKELNQISKAIKEYSPDRVFVEWPHEEQAELDSLFQLYREGKYFLNSNLSDFYLKNEIFQLAFRVAKDNDLKRVYAVDYTDTRFPFDSLMTVIKENKQSDLQKEIEKAIRSFTTDFDNKIEQGASLLEMTCFMNTAQLRQISNKFHTEIPLLAGDTDNFTGAYLISEWYRRNLYIWSLVQKNTTPDNKKVMLLMGASHVATIKEFIEKNNMWKTTELKDIMD
ncbi:DUF5694 domain-containing protein [Sinomicrobium weinanense]|uniref:Uncharacterized protein n=1 Tax=Sinomicrobium weinanense TaxID=2842200 RepID=A0A926JS80_9FLAO|nr:DUF5694 domain-containing protein [Sinomicrobium weinanense]MBC9796302.1 hypothetical protein [Sinomicrobium weinanense]MBU3123217.1 hypothetical protein [Sinomicrobium weinanense]